MIIYDIPPPPRFNVIECILFLGVPAEVICERLLPWEQASTEVVGISMPTGLHQNTSDITSAWDTPTEASTETPTELCDIEPHDYGTNDKFLPTNISNNDFSPNLFPVSISNEHSQSSCKSDNVADVDAIYNSATDSKSSVCSNTDVVTEIEQKLSESGNVAANIQNVLFPIEASPKSQVLTDNDELYEVTLTTGNIDKFRDLLAIKQQTNSSNNSLENNICAPLYEDPHEEPTELPFPWLPQCKNKTCKKFNVQPTTVMPTESCACDELNLLACDSNMKSNVVLSKAFSSDSRFTSPIKRELSHQDMSKAAAKPNVLPLRSNSNPTDEHVIPFPWSTPTSQSSPTSIHQITQSISTTSTSCYKLLPWEIPPPDPGCIRYGSLNSLSVSHDVDSICPQVSCHSMRLSEVESHLSHHSEPSFAHHHQVLDIPSRRATDLDLMLDHASGVKVEFALEYNKEEVNPRLTLYTRVMKWLTESESAVADHPEVPEYVISPDDSDTTMVF